mmetsp:Transcript_2584/g.8898  ORF Transcript_2584/g.8898 Transcript_2584/m.8898 type:complete len:203 (+) Transcript_2584:1097-1705(+)
MTYILPKHVLLSSTPSCGTPSQKTSTPSRFCCTHTRHSRTPGTCSARKCCTMRWRPLSAVSACSSCSRFATGSPHTLSSTESQKGCQMRCLHSLTRSHLGMMVSPRPLISSVVSENAILPVQFFTFFCTAGSVISVIKAMKAKFTPLMMLMSAPNSPGTLSSEPKTAALPMKPHVTVSTAVRRPPKSMWSAESEMNGDEYLL